MTGSDVRNLLNEMLAAAPSPSTAAEAITLLGALRDEDSSLLGAVRRHVEAVGAEIVWDTITRDLERSVAELLEATSDPFFGENESDEGALIALLSGRDRFDRAVGGASRLGGPLIDRARVAALDEQIRRAIDRSLPLNRVRRANRPANGSGWWWSYRVDCDEARLARMVAGSASDEDRAAELAHERVCEMCAAQLDADRSADQLLRVGASNIVSVCPPGEELHRFLAGDLPPIPAGRWLRHLELCDRCRTAAQQAVPQRRHARVAAPRKRRQWTPEVELVAFATAAANDALIPLRTLVILDPGASVADVEIGLVGMGTSALSLCLLGSELDFVAVSAADRDHEVAEGCMADVRDGFSQIDIARMPRPFVVDLGSRGRFELTDAALDTPLDPEPSDVTRARQALALGADVLAPCLLADHARRLPPGLRRRLTDEAVNRLGSLLDAVRWTVLAERVDRPIPPTSGPPPQDTVGVIGTLAAWRGHGAVVSVVAPLHVGGLREPQEVEELEGEDPALKRSLASAAALGVGLARRDRGLRLLGQDELPPAPYPRMDFAELGPAGVGRSLELAAALAAYSREVDRPVPWRLAVTGQLDVDTATVEPIDPATLREKLAAAARERPGARVLVPRAHERQVPSVPGIDVIFVSTFGEAVEATFGRSIRTAMTASEPQRLLDDAFHKERTYDREGALQCAVTFLSQHAGEATQGELLRAEWLAGMNLVHLGRPDEARGHFDRAWPVARALEAAGDLDHSDAVFLALGHADGLADVFEQGAALATLELALGYARGLPAMRSKLEGMRGLILTYAHRAAEAEPALRAALRTADRLDRARFHCWLSLALTDLGRFDEAQDEINTGLGWVERLRGPAHRMDAIYLQRARARLELGRLLPRSAEAAADAGLNLCEPTEFPYPRTSLIRLRGLAKFARGDVKDGIATLLSLRQFVAKAKTPFMRLVHGLGLIALAERLLTREPDTELTRESTAEARGLIEGYAPLWRWLQREPPPMGLEDSKALFTETLRRTPY